MLRTRRLSCPLIRKAKAADAANMAELVINSNSLFIKSVFDGNTVGGFKVLKKQFEEYNDGLFVLLEGEQVIGIMKLHLPDQLFGDTISFKQLISILGIRKGIRAGILLSHWDEHKLKPEEAYIEYLYVHQDWEMFDVKTLMLEHAYHQATLAGAKYVTHFIPTVSYRDHQSFEEHGFVLRKRIFSPLAKLMGAEHASWYRATYNLTDAPITVKEYVVDKIDQVRAVWQQRRREIMAAVRLNVALTSIPLIAGTLAYIRGYPLAVTFWTLIALGHLLGAKLYLNGSTYGRYGLMIALLAEGVNLVTRAVSTENWFDRSWLLPLSLLTFWVVSVLFRNPNARFDPQISTA